MNKTKIEWATHTWNPITGCRHGCSYCYARKMAMRFQGHFDPTIHPERLYQAVKNKVRRTRKGSRIFVGSMADMWGKWIPDHWIRLVLQFIYEFPQHQFIFLSKNPIRYADFKMPQNVLCGATIVDNEKAKNLCLNCVDFANFEPLQSEIKYIPKRMKWIIIGAQTNPYKPPKKEWVESIIKQSRTNNIPIFIKDNLRWSKKIQEFPK